MIKKIIIDQEIINEGRIQRAKVIAEAVNPSNEEVIKARERGFKRFNKLSREQLIAKIDDIEFIMNGLFD